MVAGTLEEGDTFLFLVNHGPSTQGRVLGFPAVTSFSYRSFVFYQAGLTEVLETTDKEVGPFSL